MRLFIILASVIILTSCSFKTVYLKSAIKGQILDAETNQPIANQGYIASFLAENNQKAVKTDGNDFFYLKEAIDDDLIKFNAYQKFQNIPQEIYIYISGYERRAFSFVNFPQNPKNGGMYTKSVVDIGKVYLKKCIKIDCD